MSRATTATLLPLMVVVLVAFLTIGLAIPVLPLHVHQDLGLATAWVGVVTGVQFAASLISRLWAGRFADHQGSRRAVTGGLLGACAAGLLYLRTRVVPYRCARGRWGRRCEEKHRDAQRIA